MDSALAAVFKAMLSLAAGIAGLVTRLFTHAAIARSNASARPRKTSRTDTQETERLAGCRDVVLQFARVYGHIAREGMSRTELEALIDSGMTPQELTRELFQRIEATPGIVLGVNSINPTIEIKLPTSQRARHCYIIGKSGSGKTNLIRLMAMQDLSEGNGIGMIAPEQELLTEEIMPYIPDERMDNVVYFNPSDTQSPIPFNPLHVAEGEDIDLKVDDNLTIFKRLMGETQARMDEILRQALYALMARPGSTLLDMEKLLSRSDDAFRNEVVRTSDDEQTRYFFASTYPSFPKDAHLPITTRINRLVRPRMVRTLLCQPGKCFNFREAMDEGKILLFNLSDGLIGQQTAELLGQLIVSKIQLAAMSRMDVPKAARRPFYLYMDEFQTFTGVNETSYEKMLSRARKYELCLILAHQQTGQIPKLLMREILGNVSTLIAFNISHVDATIFTQEYPVDMGGKIDYVPVEEFVSLPVGQAWGKIGKSVFPLKTALAPQQPDFTRTKNVIERSRTNYGLHAKPAVKAQPQTQKAAAASEEFPFDETKVF
jgi:Type IV secretion-system coupling protein DNA-binding domain